MKCVDLNGIFITSRCFLWTIIFVTLNFVCQDLHMLSDTTGLHHKSVCTNYRPKPNRPTIYASTLASNLGLNLCKNMNSCKVYDKQYLLSLNTSLHELNFEEKSRIELYGIAACESEGPRARPTVGLISKRPRPRGSRCGIIKRIHKASPVPKVIYGNFRSVVNKEDELRLVMNRKPYRYFNTIMCTESWLTEKQPNTWSALSDWTVIRQDRTHAGGGGVCIMLKDSYYGNNTKVLAKHCSEDVEYLIIKTRPKYLPREFASVIIACAYVHKKSPDSVLNILVKDLQYHIGNNPQSLLVLAGDFNQTPTSVFRNMGLYQYVSFPTRGKNKLDLIWTNCENVYKAKEYPPLGRSDHCTILLFPVYVQQSVTCQNNHKKQIMITYDEEKFKADMETTDWEIFKEDGTGASKTAELVTSYIQFVIKSCIIKSRVEKQFQPAWFSVEQQNILNLKHQAKDEKQKKELAKVLCNQIKKDKFKYGQSVKRKIQNGNINDKWSELRNLSGYKQKCKPKDIDLSPNELNNFYARYEELGVIPVENSVSKEFEVPEEITEQEVLNSMKRLKAGSSPGPDFIPPALLKSAKYALCPILTFLFNLCATTGVFPDSWKESMIKPLPKTNTPTQLKDYRPVVLTSQIGKCYEYVMKQRLLNVVTPKLDPLQFAYLAKRSTEDALLCLMDNIYRYTDPLNSITRVTLLDYSSAFNTVAHTQVMDILPSYGCPGYILSMVASFLSNREQYVKIGKQSSDIILSNTGTPQGSVISPLLFILYTDNLRSECENCTILKYADDTVLIGHIKNKNEYDQYQLELNRIAKWSAEKGLILNPSKTNELVFDFSKKGHLYGKAKQITINSVEINAQDNAKYLGVTLQDNLSWELHVQSILHKSVARMYHLKRFVSFIRDRELNWLLYVTIVRPLLEYAVCVWHFGLNQKQIRCLQRQENIATSIMGIRGTQDMLLEERREARCIKKYKALIEQDSTHIPRLLPSGRLAVPLCRTGRTKNSYFNKMPALYNALL